MTLSILTRCGHSVLSSLILLGALVLANGCGAPPPPPPPKAAPPPVEEVFPFDVVARLEQAPGNIAVRPDGSIFVTLHPFFSPPFPIARIEDNQLLEAMRDLELVSPLGLRADSAGTVWILDNARSSPDAAPKLVGRGSNGATRNYELSSVVPDDSFVNDVAIDLRHRFAYIADPAGGQNAALLIVNLRNGDTRRVLEGHDSVIPEDIELVIDGTPVQLSNPDGEKRSARVGVNPIALDSDSEWLYYGPMHGTSLYRVKTSDLRNRKLSDSNLAERVERFGEKPICDGIVIDENGTIYLGDLANNAIGKLDSEGNYEVLRADPDLSWIDAFALSPDGKVYAVANQLHRSAALNGGAEPTAQPPFLLVRFDPASSKISIPTR